MKSEKILFFVVIALLLLLVDAKAMGSSNVQKKIIINGHSGSGPGQVGFKVKETDAPYEAVPSAIAIDAKGNVYIADIANERVVKFDSNGTHLNDIKYQVINNMATDRNDNLYITNSEKLSIDKYSSDGKFVLSIDLRDKDIRWREKEGWTNYPIQIEGIMLDVAGNIYLRGFQELIKISSNGNVEKKWADIRIFFLDEAGNLFLKREEAWEKYDRAGNSLGIVKCERPYFKVENTKCNYPRFIDKNGYMYFYEKEQPEGKGAMVKVDKQGREYGRAPFEPFENLQKFDVYGNLYIFNFKDDKFWIEKITWN